MGISYDRDSTYTITAVDNTIKATFTDKGNVVADWIDGILDFHRHRLDQLIVGFDVEWCPNTMYGSGEKNPVALLQLCVGRRCLVFQLIHCDYFPQELDDFLGDNRFRFVGVGIMEDNFKLWISHTLTLGNDVQKVDLRDLAEEKMGRRTRQWGLKKLANEIMRVHMEKPKRITISNWGRRTLSYDQIEYAAVDAFVSFEVGRRLFAGDF